MHEHISSRVISMQSRCPSMAQVRVALALCVLLVHSVAWEAQAASYTVGNSAGWDISTDLQSWTEGKTFNVGDVLVFTYSKYHNLNQVNAAGFKNCTAANALLSKSDGNTTVPLTAPGDWYFIDSNQMYCLGGMKLDVFVSQQGSPAAAGAPAGAPQASPGGALDPSTDDPGVPSLVIGGSNILQLGVGPLLATWLCVAAALFV